MQFTRGEKLNEIVIIEPDVYSDERGCFYETFQRERFLQHDIPTMFVQDNVSISEKNVLRGLHYQLNRPQGKLVCVVDGEILDVAVDIRRGSPTFGSWEVFTVSSDNHRMVFVPAGFAHGFYVVSDSARVVYKCTDYYAPLDEYGIQWKDEALSIPWPVKNPLVSERDEHLPLLNDIDEENLPNY